MTGARRKNGRQDGNTSTERTPMGAVAMVLGRRQVTVSGCRRIVEYSSVRVRLAIEGGELIIEGRGLSVYTYCGDELVIRGVLDGVRFGDGG